MQNPLSSSFFKKKSLGQHFLTSVDIARTLIDAASIEKGERVIEIGPGDGMVTRELLARGAYVTAIEKDASLLPILQEAFADALASKTLKIIEGDIREVELPSEPYKVAANIPYYLTGDIIRTLLTAKNQPQTIGLLVQKEVARRITDPEKESILSLSVKAFGTPAYIRTVKAGSFSPAPRVDSAIIAIRDISRVNFTTTSEKNFFALLHVAFGEKRKQIRSTLSRHIPRNQVEAVLETCDVAPTTRPEDIPLEKWLLLSDKLTIPMHR